MQKIAIVCLAALVSVSCMQKKYGAFTVQGKIAHVPEQPGLYLYLEKVTFNSTSNASLDSVKLAATGEYKLKGTGNEEDLYLLSINHHPISIIINDNDAIVMNVDLASSRLPVIKSSEATSSLYAFIGTMLQRDSVIKSISAQLDTISKKTAVDSVTAEALVAQRAKEIDAINGEIKNIVTTSTSPALVCYALRRAGDTGPQALDSLVKTAALRFKQHNTIAIIKSLVMQGDAQSASPQQQGQDAPAPYALLNQQAPDLSMNSIDGKTLSIKNFRGKYVLVDFWASWCGPCRAENPNVVDAYNKFKDKNFTILGVSLDNDKSAWADAIKHDGLAWNQMSDLKQWESAAVNTYHFDGIPFNVLIDPAGKIIASELRGPNLQAKLAEVLK